MTTRDDDRRAVLALTFDDGPDPRWTPAVLERLAEADATATFFVLGERVRENPELIDAIRAGGHTIGLHGDAHLDHARSEPAAIVDDTDRALATLVELGVDPALWRLPWGRGTATSAEIALDRGLRIVGWDADTHDWRGDGWDDQPEAVRAVAAGGGVVLLHDAVGPGATRESCANTVALTGEFLALAREHGVAVRALHDSREPHLG